jgi:hypothetical protein
VDKVMESSVCVLRKAVCLRYGHRLRRMITLDNPRNS